MRILVIGSDGFLGNSVKNILSKKHDVYGATRRVSQNRNHVQIDLMDRATIAAALRQVKPQVIINCAGVVANNESANVNPVFTQNLLLEAVASGLKFNRIVITGSAAEYGVVDPKNIPVKESTPLNAFSPYGLSKVKEAEIALEMGKKHHLPVVIIRIFNPIGVGMNEKFLVPAIIRQIEEVKIGKRLTVEVARLDARRDFTDVEDVALAVSALLKHDLKEDVYNIGSGRSVSNGEIVDMVLAKSGLDTMPVVTQTSPNPEALVAIQADISRITAETGWKPIHTLDRTIKTLIKSVLKPVHGVDDTAKEVIHV